MSDTKACPFCGEEILAVAIRCKHCKSDIPTDGGLQSPPNQTALEHKPNAENRKQLIKYGVIAAVLIPLIAILVMNVGSDFSEKRAARERLKELRSMADSKDDQQGAQSKLETEAEAAVQIAQLALAIRCNAAPDSSKIVSGLQSAGLIESKASLVIDSVSSFKVIKPFEVWGMKVIVIQGFDEYPNKVFERGPGTSPGTQIGVVVSIPEAEVKERLLALQIAKPSVDQAMLTDDFVKKLQASSATEINCKAQ